MNDPLRRHLLMLHRPHHKRGAWHFPPLRVRLAVMGLHMTHEACQQQAAAKVVHAAMTQREVLHVECRSYVMLPRGG